MSVTVKEKTEVKVLDQIIEGNYSLYHGDSCEVIKGIPDNSIGYTITSPPFASLYTFSDSRRDISNCASYDQFSEHMVFLAKELYRVTQPGRLLSFHCMQLTATLQSDGYMGVKDFRGDLIRLFQAAGFIFHSEVTIWKCPVTAMYRTKAPGLFHKNVEKDSAGSRQGLADYLVTMRKRGTNEKPIKGRLNQYYADGSNPIDSFTWDTLPDGSPYQRPTGYTSKADSTRIWERYASPVWMDINPSDTLQKDSARDSEDERHISLLQLGIIRRGLQLWSNRDDVVFDPFGGIGSVGHVALEHGRKYIGIELKESYHRVAVRNLAAAANQPIQQSLF